MRLVPVILSNNIDGFRQKIAQAESFTNYAQIDFTDGKFVPSTTIPPAEAATVKTRLKLEAHLMVKDPIAYLEALEGMPFVKAFFHYEAVENHRSLIDRIRDMDMQVGLAINPHTTIDDFSDLLEGLNSVLFLTVDPAIYGSPFHVEVLEKYLQFKDAYPNIEAGFDGGIVLDNLDIIMGVTPDFVCVGHAIFGSPRPDMAFMEFERLIRGGGAGLRAAE